MFLTRALESIYIKFDHVHNDVFFYYCSKYGFFNILFFIFYLFLSDVTPFYEDVLLLIWNILSTFFPTIPFTESVLCSCGQEHFLFYEDIIFAVLIFLFLSFLFEETLHFSSSFLLNFFKISNFRFQKEKKLWNVISKTLAGQSVFPSFVRN